MNILFILKDFSTQLTEDLKHEISENSRFDANKASAIMKFQVGLLSAVNITQQAMMKEIRTLGNSLDESKAQSLGDIDRKVRQLEVDLIKQDIATVFCN
jgi:hypothetical protein